MLTLPNNSELSSVLDLQQKVAIPI